MRFVLLPVGTYGDLAHCLAIGTALRKRGHDVLVGTAAGFRDKVEACGLRFASILSDEDNRKVLADPGLWHRRRFFETYVRGWMCSTLLPIVSLVRAQANPHELVLVAAMSGGPGARIAGELTGARTVTLRTEPASILSVDAPPVLSGLEFLPRLPYPLRRVLLWAVHRNADRLAAGPINRVRRKFGLTPVRNVLQWSASEYQQIGLFPEWYCPRQPDWPPQLELAGFLLSPGGSVLAPEVERFLAAGEPPVVITFGTGMQRAQALFSMAIEACRTLGLRAMLVAPLGEGMPDPLPEGVGAFHFIPFADLLPRARALIHHAGTGTMAQAMASGIPQVALPLAHDHYDNLDRIRRLACGDGMPSYKATPRHLAALLESVLGSSEIAASCKRRATQLHAVDSIELACDALERGPPP